VKTALKRTHFQSVVEVKSNTANLLKKRVSSDDPQHCFEWKICMQQAAVHRLRGVEHGEGDIN
jgi:hypothetical protein